MTDFLRVHLPAQISELSDLARKIWTQHYTPIIGRDQVEYMLDRFQSASAITEQLAEGYEYYLVRRGGTGEEAEAGAEAGAGAGYLAVVPDADGRALMISKLYVAESERGQGLGRRMLEFSEDLCRERQMGKLWLTVNKNNLDSLEWYKHRGFQNVGPVVTDIGAGFVMDDFRLEKRVLYDGVGKVL